MDWIKWFQENPVTSAVGHGLDVYNEDVVDRVMGGLLYQMAQNDAAWNLFRPGSFQTRMDVLDAFERGGHQAAVDAYEADEGALKRMIGEFIADPLNLLLPLGLPKWAMQAGKAGRLAELAEKSPSLRQAIDIAAEARDPIGWMASRTVGKPAGAAWDWAKENVPGLKLSRQAQMTARERNVGNLMTQLAQAGFTFEDYGKAELTRRMLRGKGPVTDDMVAQAMDVLGRQGMTEQAEELGREWQLYRKGIGAERAPRATTVNAPQELGLNAAFAGPGFAMGYAADQGEEDPTRAGLAGAAGLLGLGAVLAGAGRRIPLLHYSNRPLEQADPAFFGTGVRGAEVARLLEEGVPVTHWFRRDTNRRPFEYRLTGKEAHEAEVPKGELFEVYFGDGRGRLAGEDGELKTYSQIRDEGYKGLLFGDQVQLFEPQPVDYVGRSKATPRDRVTATNYREFIPDFQDPYPAKAWVGAAIADENGNNLLDALKPGAGEEEIFQAVPWLPELLDQAGVRIVRYPQLEGTISRGLGQWKYEGRPFSEGDVHLRLEGKTPEAIDWVLANVGKRGNQGQTLVFHDNGPTLFSRFVVKSGLGPEMDNALADALFEAAGDNGWHAFYDKGSNGAGFHIGNTLGDDPEQEAVFRARMNRIAGVLQQHGVQLEQSADGAAYHTHRVRVVDLNGGNYDEIIARGPQGAGPGGAEAGLEEGALGAPDGGRAAAGTGGVGPPEAGTVRPLGSGVQEAQGQVAPTTQSLGAVAPLVGMAGGAAIGGQDEQGQFDPARAAAMGLLGLGMIRGKESAKWLREQLGGYSKKNPGGVIAQVAGTVPQPFPVGPKRPAAWAAQMPLAGGKHSPRQAAEVARQVIREHGFAQGYDLTGTIAKDGNPSVMLSLKNTDKATAVRIAQAWADRTGMDAVMVQHSLGPDQMGFSQRWGLFQVDVSSDRAMERVKGILAKHPEIDYFIFDNPHSGTRSVLVLSGSDPNAPGMLQRLPAQAVTEPLQQELTGIPGAYIALNKEGVPSGGVVWKVRSSNGSAGAAGNASAGVAGAAGQPPAGGVAVAAGGAVEGAAGDAAFRQRLLDILDAQNWNLSGWAREQLRGFGPAFTRIYEQYAQDPRKAREAFQAAQVKLGETPAEVGDFATGLEKYRQALIDNPDLKKHLQNIEAIERRWGDLDPLQTQPAVAALQKMDRDFARQLGVKSPEGLAKYGSKLLALWREQALISVSFLLNNLTDAGVKSGMHGFALTDLGANMQSALKLWLDGMRGKSLGAVDSLPDGPTVRSLLKAWGEEAPPQEIRQTMAKYGFDEKNLLKAAWSDVGLGGSEKTKALTRAAGGAALGAVGGPMGAALGVLHAATLPQQATAIRLLNAAIEYTARSSAWLYKRQQIISERLPGFLDELSGAGLGQVAEELRNSRGLFSPKDVAQMAEKLSGDHDLARGFSQKWAGILDESNREGVRLANEINFDYGKETQLDAALRKLFAFHFWAVRNVPFYAVHLAENPGLAMALWRWNQLSREETEEKGLTGRFAGMVSTGKLGFGDVLGEALFGRDGQVFFNPALYVSIMGQLRPPRTGEDDPWLRQALAAGQNFGLSPIPQVSMGLQATRNLDPTGQGLLGDNPAGNVFRASSLISALAGAAQGQPVDIEAPLKNVVGGSMDFNRYYILKRIAEKSVEETGQPNHPDYLAAMTNPSSPIYRQAAADVARDNLVTQTSGFMGVPLKFLPETEARVRAEQKKMPKVEDDQALPEKERNVLIRSRMKRDNPLLDTYREPNRDLQRDSQKQQTLSQQEEAIWQRWLAATPQQKAEMWKDESVRFVVQKRLMEGAATAPRKSVGAGR